MGIDSGVNLLVASLDLQLVRLLRDAIRTADLSSGKGAGIGGAAGVGPRPVATPTPRIESRPVIHPTLRIEPRMSAHPVKPEPPVDVVVISTHEPEQSRIKQSPIQPPWKVLPWEKPSEPEPKLKVIQRRPDVPVKGTVFDVFI